MSAGKRHGDGAAGERLDWDTWGLPPLVELPPSWDALSDAELAEIAEWSDEPGLRMLALELLDGPVSVFIKVACLDRDEFVRQTAVRKLTHQRALAAIAGTDKAAIVRWTAAERLDDQVALVRIARLDRDARVRVAATARLVDDAELIEIAKNDRDWRVRAAAARKITDLKLLSSIAQTDPDRRVRLVAAQLQLELPGIIDAPS